VAHCRIRIRLYVLIYIALDLFNLCMYVHIYIHINICIYLNHMYVYTCIHTYYVHTFCTYQLNLNNSFCYIQSKAMQVIMVHRRIGRNICRSEFKSFLIVVLICGFVFSLFSQLLFRDS
jgi:hypothetical protein